LGNIDPESKEVIQAEEKQEALLAEQLLAKSIRKKNKMRGRQKIGARLVQKGKQKEQDQKQKLREVVNAKFRQKHAEKEKKKAELELLAKLDSIEDFDPFVILERKRQEKEVRAKAS